MKRRFKKLDLLDFIRALAPKFSRFISLTTLFFMASLISQNSFSETIKDNYGIFANSETAEQRCYELRNEITGNENRCQHGTYQLHKVCPNPIYPDNPDYYSYTDDYYINWLDGATRYNIRFSYCPNSCPPTYPNMSADGVCMTDEQISGVEDLNVGEIECAAGNPVDIATGNKFQEEVDFIFPGASWFVFKRIYNSRRGEWRHNYQKHLYFSEDVSAVSAAKPYNVPDKTPVAFAERGDGKLYKFYQCDGDQWCSISQDSIELLQSETDNAPFKLVVDGMVENYQLVNGSWLLTKIELLGTGNYLTLNHFDSSIRVSDNLGHAINIVLNGEGQVIGLELPSEHYFNYQYQDNRLVRANYPDGSFKVYHYENLLFPDALTGITDQRGIRFTSWEYNDEGQATSSEHANGVEGVTLEYFPNQTTLVTNELGKQTLYRFKKIKGVIRPIAVEGKASLNCLAANSSYNYNSRGRLESITDWNGNSSRFTYNEKGLMTSKVQAQGSVVEREVQINWHPIFRLPEIITMPGYTIRYQYDAAAKIVGKEISATQPDL